MLSALQPDLAANEAQLLRKIQLLCLMEVSRHPGTARCVNDCRKLSVESVFLMRYTTNIKEEFSVH